MALPRTLAVLPHSVKQGDAIIKQGDKGDFFYICQARDHTVALLCQ